MPFTALPSFEQIEQLARWLFGDDGSHHNPGGAGDQLRHVRGNDDEEKPVDDSDHERIVTPLQGNRGRLVPAAIGRRYRIPDADLARWLAVARATAPSQREEDFVTWVLETPPIRLSGAAAIFTARAQASRSP